MLWFVEGMVGADIEDEERDPTDRSGHGGAGRLLGALLDIDQNPPPLTGGAVAERWQACTVKST